MKPNSRQAVPPTKTSAAKMTSKQSKPLEEDAPVNAQTQFRKRKSAEEPEVGGNKRPKQELPFRTAAGRLRDPICNEEEDIIANAPPKTSAAVQVAKPPQLDAKHSKMLTSELYEIYIMVRHEQYRSETDSDIDLLTAKCYSDDKELKQYTPEASAGDKETSKALDRASTPITNIYEIFDDFAKKSVNFNFEGALPKFGLRIATMCSGTEAPLLAMDLMKQAMSRLDKKFVDFTHVFSVEIEPFKQAYIERNFNPPLLFRDVIEFETAEELHTAYGGRVPQPKHINILVAGPSCVDHSSLNNSRKEVKNGESTKTWNGVKAYINRHRPNMVILENVLNAKWDEKVKWFSNHDYVAHFLKCDTKNFYLPQTRQRGYLIAFEKNLLKVNFNTKEVLQQWEYYMFHYQKRANAPFTDFICDDDDPRLHEARFALEAANPTSKAADWAACRHRYANFRIDKQYGSLRTMTHWQNNGSCRFPDFGWIKWAKSQRERIWDTLEIQYLSHAAERNYDMNYKARFFDLSQNVDRDSDTKQWGIVGCLTPSGQPYLTSRGGPVSGFESLILQGIPIDHLNLTKETARQLQDLAGNAMSVPVVNAAILSGILAVHGGMKTSSGSFFSDYSNFYTLENASAATPNPAPKAKSLQELQENMGRNEEEYVHVNSPVATTGSTSILDEASKTLQFCKCEGTFGRKAGPFQHCKNCGHTTCQTCGHNPIHDYCEIPKDVVECRLSPAGFMKKISEALPTVLCLSATNASHLASCLKLQPGDDAEYKKTYLEAARLAFGATVYFRHVKRGHSWKVTFEGPDARLELRITRKCPLSASSKDAFFGRSAIDCYWLLFAKPNSSNQPDSDLRVVLQQPIARMIPEETLLSGKWELFHAVAVKLDISAVGRPVPSWESEMGLQKKTFKELKRPASLYVSISPLQTDEFPEVAKAVTGHYFLQAHCGGASASMHVRDPDENQDAPLMFFFLDPEQLTNATLDCFVFSTTNYRAGYKEYRLIQAKVEANWRPTDLQQFSQPRNSNDVTTETVAKSSGGQKSQSTSSSRKPPPAKDSTITKHQPQGAGSMSPTVTFHEWKHCEDLNLRVCTTMNTQKLIMPADSVSISQNTDCKAGSPWLIVELPVTSYKGSDWKLEEQYDVPLVDKTEALQQYSWLLKRAAHQMLKKFNGPQQVATANLVTASCCTCAPKAPSVICKFDNKGKFKYAAEDKEEATDHENALKQRPPPITATIHCNAKDSAALEIRLNIPTLCHRVLAKMHFSEHMRLETTTLKWWVMEDHGRDITPNFKVNPFLDNSKESRTRKPTKFCRDLWPEQERVLTWMVCQEEKPCEWYEQEREEVCVPALGCRIDVEARAPKQIRGGVLADEVGGGKTATSLALIATMLENKSRACTPPQDHNSIFVDATLILVPAGLINQWKQEADTCFGNTDADRRLVLTDDSRPRKGVINVHKLKLSDLREKDIIIAPWTLFDKDGYWKALEKWSEVQKHPKSARAFQGWLQKALAALVELTATPAGRKINGASLLHAVTWRRTIIDEYSILEDKSFLAILALKSLSRWLLSGTPPTSSFDAVNATARLLTTKLTSENDELNGSFKLVTKGTRLIKDKTSAEQFLWYQANRSPAWLRARNQLAYAFIEKFVRKNSAEAAKDIASVAHYEVSMLSAHEHITYYEVFQRLMGQPFKFGSKPRKDIENMTRSERIDEVITTSLHTEDALLSCCSTLSNINQVSETALSATGMCKLVVQDADETIVTLIRNIRNILKETFWCEKPQSAQDDDIPQNSHFHSYKLQVIGNDFGDMCTSVLIDQLMHAAYLSRAQPTSPYTRRRKTTPDSKKPESKKTGLAKLEPEAEPVNGEEEAADQEADDEHGEQDAAPEEPSAEDDEEEEEEDVTNEGKVTLGDAEMKARCEDLSTITIELVEQIRLRRVFKNIQTIISGEKLPECAGCCKTDRKLEELSILGICGHMACERCLSNKDVREHDPTGCLDRNCGGPASQHNLMAAAPFADIQRSSTTTANSKIDAVVKKVESILQSEAPFPEDNGEGDEILIFVQFSRVRAALIEALTKAGITYTDASIGGAKAIGLVEKFRTGKTEGGARVLVLDINSADAAGW
jgi:site-specific DNA-cytosine methylase